MAEVIKLKTYKYDYIDYNLPAVKDAEGNELPREPQHWFVTLRADINPEKVRAHLSESLKQDIQLTLEDEFEITRPATKSGPNTDSIYDREEIEEPETKNIIDMPINLDIGDKVKHPMFGEGEVVDYYVTEYKPGDIINKDTKPLFCYAIAYKQDEYDDPKTGERKQPTRMFTPRSLYDAINISSSIE